MVRPATYIDLPRIIEMGRRFHRAARLPGRFMPGDFKALCENLITEPSGCIFLSTMGMVGAYLAPVPWDRAYVVANEVFWWSEDGRGLDLLNALEGWASPHASEIRFTLLESMRPKAVARVLKRQGYRPSEAGYVKWASQLPSVQSQA